MARIVVGSQNPVKVAAAAAAARRWLQAEVTVEGVDVPSGVSDQPSSDSETKRGAENRAAAVLREFPDVDFAVGIEGGIEVIGGQMYAFAWVVIRHGESVGSSRSAAFLLPPRVCELVLSGQELGHANDEVFSTHNSKQQSGAVGLLTQDAISRQALYEHAADLALIPMRNRHLFPSAASHGRH